MKKITAFVLAILLFTANGAAANNAQETVGINESEAIASSSESVSRQDAAMLFARLLGSDGLSEFSEIYADVPGDAFNASYINYLYGFDIFKTDDGLFYPELPVTATEAIRGFLIVLEYDKAVLGEDATAFACAANTGLLRGVSFSQDGYITKKSFINMFENALAATISRSTKLSADGNSRVSTSGAASLYSRLHINAYTGTIVRANDEAYSVTFEVNGNKQYNPESLNADAEYSFACSGDIDINKYEGVPVTIWVKDDEIFFLTEQSGAEVFYAVIDSVNGDDSRENSYSSAYLRYIALQDHKGVYYVDNLKVKYNFKITQIPVKLSGRLAKIVTMNNSIIYIESWDLSAGGIISSVEADEIIYKIGIQNEARIRDLDTYKKKLVIIDGDSTDLNRLRPDSVISYYADDSGLMLAVSEMAITGTLDGVGSDEVTIDNVFYKKGNVCYSSDGDQYDTQTPPVSLFGAEVTAYFDYAGECLYVKPFLLDSMVTPFWAYITNLKETAFGNITEMELIRLEPEIQKNIYAVNSKLSYKGGVTKAELMGGVCNMDGSGLFVFTRNRDGEIISVSPPTTYEGVSESAIPITIFPDDTTLPHISAYGDNLYFVGAKILGLYKADGIFSVKEAQWGDLRFTNAANVTMRFYGKQDSSDVIYALICGETENIYSRTVSYGVVNRKTTVLSTEGNLQYKIDVKGKNGGEYILSQADGDKLRDGSFIQYNRLRTFSDSEIFISSVTDLSGAIDSWGAGFEYGTIRKIDSKRVYFDDGRIYFLHPTFCAVIRCYSGKQNEFELSNTYDIDSGDRAAIIRTTSGVMSLIFQR